MDWGSGSLLGRSIEVLRAILVVLFESEKSQFLHMPTYYDLLGVSNIASHEEVTRRFKQLARIYHPDVNPGARARERFLEVSAAYNVLSNPNSRAEYDKNLTGKRSKSRKEAPKSSIDVFSKGLGPVQLLLLLILVAIVAAQAFVSMDEVQKFDFSKFLNRSTLDTAINP